MSDTKQRITVRPIHSVTRRTFCRTALVAGSGIALPASNENAIASPEPQLQRIAAFSKPLQPLSFDELADTVAALGFDGIEGTIRKGGHIEPERVEDDLPKMVDALRKRDLEIIVMASSVNNLTDPYSEKTLRTAAKVGIKKYRMAYYRYDLNRPIAAQLEAIRPALDDLVALNRELGLTALYQNHSGSRTVGAPIWDIYSLIKDYDSQDVAIALDTAHTTIEGGLCWPIHYNLARPHLGALYVKDFGWKGRRVDWRPLGEGHLATQLFQEVIKSGFSGPISLHVEYLDRNQPDSVDKHVTAFRRDLKTLRAWIQKASTANEDG